MDGNSLDIRSIARRVPNKIGLVLGEREWSYGELSARAADRARTWTDVDGILAIQCRPVLDEFINLFAALSAGRPALLLHPKWLSGQLNSTLDRVGCAWVADDGRLRRHTAPPSSLTPAPKAAILLTTSGSTGLPKIVQHSLASLCAAAQASAANLPWIHGDRWLLSLPYSHIGGLSILVRCLLAEVPIVVGTGSFQDVEFLNWCDDRGVTRYSMVPTQLIDLVATRRHHPNSPRLVRTILVGGAPAPLPLRTSAADAGLPVLYTYGMTEAGSQVTTQRPTALSMRPDVTDVGFPLPGVEIAIDEESRIRVRGPNLMLGYLDSMPEKAGIDPSGWLATNDRGRLLDDGRLQLMGRLDHVLISGGENVDPEWVEQALVQCDDVDEIAILGVADERWGEQIVALVKSPSSDEPTQVERRILDHARSVLPDFAVPKELRFVHDLPQKGIGKLDRARLLDTFRQAPPSR